MRAAPVITGAVLLMFALGACGQAADQVAPANQPAPATGGSASAPPSVPPSSPGSSAPPPATGLPPGTGELPPGAGEVPRDRLDTSALPSYYPDRGKVWVLNEGRTLQLMAVARNACAGVTAKVVEQNETLVHIVISPMDAPQGGTPDGPGMCAQVITPTSVTVDLKVPLGNRRVVVSEG